MSVFNLFCFLNITALQSCMLVTIPVKSIGKTERITCKLSGSHKNTHAQNILISGLYDSYDSFKGFPWN
jgi:hypothetical protein